MMLSTTPEVKEHHATSDNREHLPHHCGRYGIRWPENGEAPTRPDSVPRPTRDAGSPRTSPPGSIAAHRRRTSPSTRSATCSSTVTAHRLQRTVRRWRTSDPARRAFGDWKLPELEGAAADIARWRACWPATSRYRLTLALRQALGAAVRWHYLSRNPAVEAGRNPEPRAEELQPFTRGEIDALATELGPVYGRWSSSSPRRACARTSGPRSSAATSTAPAPPSRCSGATATGR